jgi:hypothetical protein
MIEKYQANDNNIFKNMKNSNTVNLDMGYNDNEI